MIEKRGSTSSFVTLLLLFLTAAAAFLSVYYHATRAPRNHSLNNLTLFPPGPDTLEEQLVAASAQAAMTGSDDRKELVADARALLIRRPLSATALLILGAEKQISGDSIAAERLYATARSRDPRDVAARLLFADAMLRKGKVNEGIEELLAAEQLRPSISPATTKALAEYLLLAAPDPSIAGAIAKYPDSFNRAFGVLAQDADNLPLLLRLSALAPVPLASRPWVVTSMNSLIVAGKVSDARKLWSSAFGTGEEGSVFNSSFKKGNKPPPFNWEVISSTSGIAELKEGGGLSIVSYGRSDAVFARQLILLPAGRYRLKSKARAGDFAGQLYWAVRCPQDLEILKVSFSDSGDAAGMFEVAENCKFQWLELHTRNADQSHPFETEVHGVDVKPSGLRV